MKLFTGWLLCALALGSTPGLGAALLDVGNPYDRIGDGQRVSLRGGELSIQTIKNFEIYTAIPGLTLLMRAPLEDHLAYQRTIQIASFSGSRFMDDLTAREFEEVIVRKFSATTTAVKNYRMRNHTSVDLEDGRPGLLFYSDFSVDDVNLMQAHMLVSTPKKHYLITYTDVAEHFEGNTSGPYLEEAWTAMRSARFHGASPQRFRSTVTMIVAIGGVIFVMGLIWIIRMRRSGSSLIRDVGLAYEEKTAHLAKDHEGDAWTLPDPEKLSRKRRPGTRAGYDDEGDLSIEDEVS